ncbi:MULTISPECIES: AAA family ATPase [unclassified Mycolicibacterium]|uniref:AAA family ATPase n=1 Tax=unclassified Mycolicibacterium TaxID=2636767 RepID=UPI0012DF1E39|nr:MULTISPECIES: AAA family ATPase [unclassified Mycolicibacterium]MUL85037.1 AAA family ATPase [Mycolicibacterium sp. CBMA 329]MUL91004.1 AAA family ATPase [Mycolicibacterium sp. CBMA 331]MUL98325.1 AAA family ATPase [Mycolicibacterium sp. CBMA 334]MUM29066.1 AAA family ATPase [Mycolicibacterium sp. CBMA 295]MUM40763.1 AAA family ATPase [Mycolicibacterium sp. CBMA 247]
MTYEFESMSYADALKLADEGETWIVEDVIGSATTLIYGEAKAGKSFLVSALIQALATGTDFLGKPVPQDRAFSVAVCWTDDRGAQEYSERIRTVMPETSTPDARFYHLPIMRTPEMWQALYDCVMAEGHNFVVIDNLAQTLNGSINEDAVVRQFFDGVRLFVRAGIPVVVVAHSSDKAGPNGYKPDTPMGSAYISQAVRWRVFARRSRRGNITLKFVGNHSEPYEMTLSHGAGARFEVIDTKSPEAVKAAAEGAERVRTARRLDANDVLLQWLRTNCKGMTVRDAAAKLAADQGIKETTSKSRITRAGIRKDGDSWVRLDAA